MPMAVGEVLTFKHFQSKDGQMLLNVFHFQIGSVASADVSAYTETAHGFYNTFANVIKPLQVPGLAHERTLVEELTGLEYGDWIPPTKIVGTQNTEALPIFNAASIQYVRGSKITRHGWKRIGGVAEFFTLANTLTSAALSILQDAIDTCMNPSGVIIPQLDAEDGEIGTISLFPVIVGNPAAEGDPFRVQRAVSVVPKSLVTTQNTRKIGRGA